MITLRSTHPALATAAALEPIQTHQPFDALAVTTVPLVSQLLGHARTAIPSFVLLVNAPDSLNPQPVSHLAHRFTPATPGVVATSRHFQHRTQLPDRIRLGHALD